MNSIAAETQAQHKTLNLIIAAFSLIFIFILTNGYYNLFLSKGYFFATTIGAILALLAWTLAKFIGTSDGGIRDNTPLFSLLLLLSAVGVFNSLMINLEGKRIFLETIDDSSYRFSEVPQRAKEILNDPDLEAKKARVEKLKENFFSELRNLNRPGNRGG